uniref:DUF4455 domain-containing protein n=1 Tax=Octopus bimaculoides TaxID=37653 RepID=A0A0L8I482_OCTBM
MSQSERVSVVPSGKVYGQLFEAQALLNSKLKQVERQREETKLKSSSGLLKLPFTYKLSDSAQKEEEVHKKFQCYPEARQESSALNVEMGEVKALPEIVVDKHSSDVTKRIKERRLKLHETSLEDMYQDLGVINSNIEVMLENCCKDFSEKVANIDKVTESLLEIEESDKNLMNFTFEELNKLQADVQSHTQCKLKYIQYLDYQFHEIENSRISQIQNVLFNYTNSFQEIAYLTTPEVYRLMETEVQIINQTLLNNKQSYTDIYTQLLLVSIEQDRKHHLNWKSLTTLWKNKNIQEILERFRQFMLTCVSVKPKEVEILLDEISIKFSNLLNEYKEHLQFLRNFLPPKCTKGLVEEWYGKINEVTEKLKKEKREFLMQMKTEYEKCNQKGLAKMHDEEVALVNSNACTEEKASELSAKYMLPLIQLQQKNFECSLATWDDDITKAMTCTTKKLDKVYAYISAIADIWLNHTQELEAQDQKLNQMFAENRERHNADNQAEEAKLDTILDALRQGPDGAALESNLNAALAILTRLKTSYQNFHAKQIGMTTLYIPMVKDKLYQYERDICKFFKLKRYNKLPFSQTDPNDDCICADTASTSPESSRKSSKTITSPSQQPSKLLSQTEKPSSSFDIQGPKSLVSLFL